MPIRGCAGREAEERKGSVVAVAVCLLCMYSTYLHTYEFNGMSESVSVTGRCTATSKIDTLVELQLTISYPPATIPCSPSMESATDQLSSAGYLLYVLHNLYVLAYVLYVGTYLLFPLTAQCRWRNRRTVHAT